MRYTAFLVVLLAVHGSLRGEDQPRAKVLVDQNEFLSVPFGLDFLPDGSLVAADFGGHRISKVALDGTVTVIAGDGEQGYRDGPAAGARFHAPHNVAVEKDGHILVADTSNHCVRRVDGRTGQVSTIAGAPEPGFAGDGGPARRARFNQAYHVAPAGEGFLLADLGNRRIRLVADDVIRSVAGNGEEGIPADGAVAAEAPLVDPRAVAQDQKGNIWILERSGHALRVVEADGRIRTVAGTGQAGPAEDGAALSCTLRGPKYLWIEESGDVLIADTDNHCIRRYERATLRLTIVAGTGAEGRGPAGREPTATALNYPHGVAVGKDGTMYIADSMNGRILLIPGRSRAGVNRKPRS
jgi:sugar lactone lactonase YvrE